MTKILGKRAIWLATAALIAAPGLAQQAPADGASAAAASDIIVTASRSRASALQDTPLAISAFSAEQLTQSGLSDVRDLVGYVPNLSLNKTTTFAQIFIRGIGSTNVYGGSDPSVSLQVDGVYIGRSFAQFSDFLDVDRVEVLRGPQGTLYGRNATGGTINIVSRAPSDHFEGRFEAAYGNYNYFQGRAYVSGPLGENVSASLSATYLRHDPFLKNIVATGNDVDDADRGGVRGQIKVTPSDRLTLTTRVDYARAGEATTGYSTNLLPVSPISTSILGSFKKVALNEANHDTILAWGVAEDASYALSDALHLKALVAYRENQTDVDLDADNTDLFISKVHQAEKQNQTSAELNLTGNYAKFDFVTGLYYFNEKVDTDVAATAYARAVKREFLPHTTTDAYAAFAQGTYRLSEQLAVTLGVRYTGETKTIDQLAITSAVPSGAQVGAPIVFSLDRKFHAFTPKAQLEWRPRKGLMVYASATKGYKSGGFNFGGTAPTATAFAPETVWSYEVGGKGDFFDGLLRLNLTAFWYRYTNLQQFIAVAVGVANIENAATARIRGLELESTVKLSHDAQIGLNASYLDARYTNYPAAPLPQPLGAGPASATGNYLTNAPKFSGNAFFQLNHPVRGGDIVFRPEFQWFSRTWYEPTNTPIVSQKPYTLTNASIGYHSNARWAVDLWARNLTNTHYFTLVASNGATYSGQIGDPRTFGVRLSYRW